MILQDKTILVTGGTGSMGRTFVRRALSGAHGVPRRVIVFSRDEAKQHEMRLDYLHRAVATDEVIYDNFRRLLVFQIGDVTRYEDVCAALAGVDLVVNAAALKQVPACEYFPSQAIATNCRGAENLIRAIRDLRLPVETVVGVSTDKACHPVNVMGMTKAVQERLFIAANLTAPQTRFVCVRYGNVLASRGSVVPLFHDQITSGGPVTITDPEMTRFLLSLEDAVDTVLAVIEHGTAGELFVPRAPAATVADLAAALIGDLDIKTRVTGIRPGEKRHEIMLSDEEAPRTMRKGVYYALQPMLPELAGDLPQEPLLDGEYSSRDSVIGLEATRDLLARHGMLVSDVRSRRHEWIG